ncbi:2222_t:CDS:2 [Funneliformis geosporum]|uniref:16002_t:CDS:1 n=1 Tax=Funneliformis geosporum TaxID=1117311 RepID=A0A9W4WQB6_9GLOM|nr:16002_t:CDS:2 [Funneliformis geosporum]CAI2181300.1 2222_t:CDS:2 [Funneliformis geosporum]
MCRSITTQNNDDSNRIIETSPPFSQGVVTESIDSASDFTDIIEQPSSDAIMETALKMGDFKEMGLVNFTPVGFVEGFFEMLHVSTGLPWWGTIALATLILRLGFFPILISHQRNVSKLVEIQPQIEKLMEKISEARESRDQYTLLKRTEELKQLYSSVGTSPLTPLLFPLMQMPFFVSFFMALRKMAAVSVPGFDHGGILWFKDLTAPDPNLALPFLVSAGFILMLELGTDSGPVKASQGKGIKWFFRGVSVLSIPFTMTLPSSVLVYFLCANTLAFAQSALLKNKGVRKYFRLPINKPRITEVKTKSFMEQWKELNAKQQQTSTKTTASKIKKLKTK